MQGLRSLAAVIAGFGFMASTVMVGTMIAARLFLPGGMAAGGAPAGRVPLPYLAASLVVSFFGAVFGGWLAARIGRANPMGHAVALAAVTAVMAVVSAVQTAPGPQPAWYPAVMGVIGVAGVLAGGRLRAAAAAGEAVVA